MFSICLSHSSTKQNLGLPGYSTLGLGGLIIELEKVSQRMWRCSSLSLSLSPSGMLSPALTLAFLTSLHNHLVAVKTGLYYKHTHTRAHTASYYLLWTFGVCLFFYFASLQSDFGIFQRR